MFYISEIIGNGDLDAGTPFRPATFAYTGRAGMIADGRSNPNSPGGFCLVRVEAEADPGAWRTDRRIVALETVADNDTGAPGANSLILNAGYA